MAEGRQREAWDHTSFLIATLINVNSLRKGKPVQPSTFHPFTRKRARREERIPASITALRDIFIRNK